MCLMCNTLYAASKLIKEEENKSSKRCRVKPDIKLHSACSEIGPLTTVTKQVWVGIDEPGRNNPGISQQITCTQDGISCNPAICCKSISWKVIITE